MATASEEAPSAPASEPLKYQTWVLKVSVHCQACQRKVKKVLQSIEGVYTASVDLQKQKATVTGNVDAETLIKKLQKAGRHAEPWPEKPKKDKEKGNKENTTANNKDNGSGKNPKGNGKPKEKDPGAGEGGEAKLTAKHADASSKAAGNSSTEKAPSPKGGGKESTKAAEGKDAGISFPAEEKPATAEGEKAGGGGGGKKGKKGQKEGGRVDNSGEASESSGDANATGSGVTGMMYPHFPVYPQSPPVYAVNYSTAYPSASYGAVYYVAAPVVLPQQSHVYAARRQQQQHYTGYYYLPQAGVFIPPSDEEGSYDVFSDENANACRVM